MKPDEIANIVFDEARRMFEAWCRVNRYRPVADDIETRFRAEWKTPANAAIVLKLVVYFDGKRIGTAFARNDVLHGYRFFTVPNGWKA